MCMSVYILNVRVGVPVHRCRCKCVYTFDVLHTRAKVTLEMLFLIQMSMYLKHTLNAFARFCLRT